MRRMSETRIAKALQAARRQVLKHQKLNWVLGGSALMTSLLFQFDLSLFEAHLYDFRMSKGRQPTPSQEIALIALDDQSIKDLDDFAPFSLSLHTEFLEKIASTRPKGVGYLVDMNQVHQVNPELFEQSWGLRFVQAADRLESAGIPFVLGTPYEVTGEVPPPYPLSTLKHSVAFIHKDGNVFAEDKVTRRALTHLNDKPVFHALLPQLAGKIKANENPRGGYFVPEVDGHFFFFRYHGNTAWKFNSPAQLDPTSGSEIQSDRKAPYPVYSFSDVLRGKISAEKLTGKFLLIGSLSKENGADFALTPYSKQSFTHPKLLIHANILDSLMNNDGILRAPTWANWVLTFAATSVVVWWVIHFTPLLGVLFTVALAALAVAVGLLLFQSFGVWLRLSQPMLAIFLSYYLVVPYRLVREYKKRWDYQQKNEVLTQVEELKTNFLSLVTHDLKTPVARIQGLAETLSRKASSRLEPGERETLRHILKATDDLNHFISSILELNRVESAKMALNLESRDVNLLIERSLDSMQLIARRKGIELKANLEPLFPVRLDSGLISKVLNNLIENAIKYSPENKVVRVESKEIDGWIEISVIDQGIGIRESDQSNLFSRFYRVKNQETEGIPGTGLGLYLSKYFVEAHRGRITVSSHLGVGSTFKIFLPLEVELKGSELPAVQL